MLTFVEEEEEAGDEEDSMLQVDLAALDALDEMPDGSDEEEVVQKLGALLGGEQAGDRLLAASSPPPLASNWSNSHVPCA